VNQTIEHLHELAELGIQVAHSGLAGVGSLRPLDLMAAQSAESGGQRPDWSR
jgi:hypothetical protein